MRTEFVNDVRVINNKDNNNKNEKKLKLMKNEKEIFCENKNNKPTAKIKKIDKIGNIRFKNRSHCIVNIRFVLRSTVKSSFIYVYHISPAYSSLLHCFYESLYFSLSCFFLFELKKKSIKNSGQSHRFII